MPSKQNVSFFDVYAHEYDYLTDASAREPNHQKEIAALVKRFKPKSILDAGCASGLTSSLFSKMGIKAVGVDRSKQMIEVANEKYNGKKLPLEFIKADFEAMPKRLDGNFDMVVCLANSISGVGTMVNLRKAINGFKKSLKPGGWLVMQLLNYESMKENHIFPIRATRKKNIVYERFSERRGKRFSLYVTRLDIEKKPLEVEVFRHEFDNFSSEQLIKVVSGSGFSQIRKYSDLFCNKRFNKSSRDLVVIAQKPLQ